MAVAKKDGSIRLCVDYRQLNSVTIKSVYPIPEPQSLFDCLSDSKYFSTLDLSSGYYQIPLSRENAKKTAFATRLGQFEFTRMPFGLCNAPSTFQKMMASIFRGENWIKCLIYLDDILIFANSVEQHLDRLRSIFQRIREAGLKLSPKKCNFLLKEVKYLGHTISSNGISTDIEKIEKISSWPLPSTQEELVSFLGLCGYYRNHIQNFSEITVPLENLCLDKKKLIWTNDATQAFNKLKKALCSAPVLGFPNKFDDFILDTDASGNSIGAVLSQFQNGKEVVMLYASRKLSNSERNYCVTRRELLAVCFFVKKFKHYLYGKKFTVRTDHKPLLWLLSNDNPKTSQYCRWKIQLESYSFSVVHRPGKLHRNADALSRYPACKQCDLLHPKEPSKKQHHAEIVFTLNQSNNSMDKEIEKYHKELGHVGINKLYYTLRTVLPSPNLKNRIEQVISRCPACSYFKNKNGKDRAPLMYSTPHFPFERIAVDITGPLISTPDGYKYILAIIDYFSKFVILVPLKRIDAETVCNAIFNNWICLFGAPRFLHSDRGTMFQSSLMINLCKTFGIIKTRTCPYHPQADGLVERIFRTIKPMISAVSYEKCCSWEKCLPYVQIGLRSGIHSSSRRSPFETLFGFKMNITGVKSNENKSQRNLQKIQEIVRVNLQKSAEAQAKYYDKNRFHKQVNIGDSVLMRNENGKFPYKKYLGPYKVHQKINEFTYELVDRITGEKYQRHYNQIKKVEFSSTISMQGNKTSISSVSSCTLKPQEKSLYPSTVKPQEITRYPKRKHMQPSRYI